jgi:hypothetical protein
LLSFEAGLVADMNKSLKGDAMNAARQTAYNL